VYGIPASEQSPDTEDVGDKYRQYSSRTPVGARNDIIIAIYGQVTPYTEYRYWWIDSIVKQTVMLCDKSGLRKKNSIPPNPAEANRVHRFLDGDKLKNVMASLGIGIDIPEAEETEQEKAERIRQKIQSNKQQ
jgi:hypothetical protein